MKRRFKFFFRAIVLVFVALPLCFVGFLLGVLISPIRAGIQAGIDWMETPPE